MTADRTLVADARAHVERLLREKLAPWIAYHDFRHTEETAEAAQEIARAEGLDADGTELVLLAAWFHDTGYTETVQGHEARSAAIASQFLEHRGYPADRIALVRSCILATEVPQRPENRYAEVMCDADMVSLGREEFFEKNALMKREIEQREGTTIPGREWIERTLAFLEAQTYHTAYCRRELAAGLARNIAVLRGKLGRRGAASGEGVSRRAPDRPPR